MSEKRLRSQVYRRLSRVSNLPPPVLCVPALILLRKHPCAALDLVMFHVQHFPMVLLLFLLAGQPCHLDSWTLHLHHPNAACSDIAEGTINRLLNLRNTKTTISFLSARMQAHFIPSGTRSERTLWVIICFYGASFLSPNREGPRPTDFGPWGKPALCLQGVDWTSDYCQCHAQTGGQPLTCSRARRPSIRMHPISHCPDSRVLDWLWHIATNLPPLSEAFEGIFPTGKLASPATSTRKATLSTKPLCCCRDKVPAHACKHNTVHDTCTRMHAQCVGSVCHHRRPTCFWLFGEFPHLLGCSIACVVCSHRPGQNGEREKRGSWKSGKRERWRRREKENHGSSEDETADGNSSNTDCDQDSDVSFMNDTDEEIHTAHIEEEWIMEISDEKSISTRRKMGKESSRMEP